MRLASTFLLLSAFVFTGCTGTQPAAVSASTMPVVATLKETTTTIRVTTTTTPTKAPTTAAAKTQTTPTTTTQIPASPGAPATAAETTASDPSSIAQAFIVAAFTLNEPALRTLSSPTYADQAVRLWITPTDDFGTPANAPLPIGTAEPAPRILATKILVNAAGQARVAVFVDADDLAVAALPYTVDLIDIGVTWRVIDAGLPTT